MPQTCVRPRRDLSSGAVLSRVAIVETELPCRNALFEGAGLTLAAYEHVRHPVAASWQDFADKFALRTDTFVDRLPDAEFAAGIAALRAHAARHAGDVHLFVFGV